MIFCFRVKYLLLFVSCFVLCSNAGCNQQRYKPAQWRAAQGNAGGANSQNSQNAGNTTLPVGAWGVLPERSAVAPLTGGGGGTMPGRNWGSLPRRGSGSSLPGRGRGGAGIMSLPRLEGGSSLPKRRWRPPTRGGSDTMPRRRWQPAPRQGTMPSRSYEI